MPVPPTPSPSPAQQLPLSTALHHPARPQPLRLHPKLLSAAHSGVAPPHTLAGRSRSVDAVVVMSIWRTAVRSAGIATFYMRSATVCMHVTCVLLAPTYQETLLTGDLQVIMGCQAELLKEHFILCGYIVRFLLKIFPILFKFR